MSVLWSLFFDGFLEMRKTYSRTKRANQNTKMEEQVMNEKEVKKCPKCAGEMEVGYLHNAPYWRRGRSIWGFGWDGRVFACKCRNCGYVEFYCEK
jgi:hypothetical protein